MTEFKDVFKQGDSRIYSLFLYTDGRGHFDPNGNARLDYWPQDATLDPTPWIEGRPFTDDDIILVWAYIEDATFLLIDVHVEKQASFLFGGANMDCADFIAKYRNAVRLQFTHGQSLPSHGSMHSHDDLFHTTCIVPDNADCKSWNNVALREQLYEKWSKSQYMQAMRSKLIHTAAIQRKGHSGTTPLGELIPEFSACIDPHACQGIFETADLQALSRIDADWEKRKEFDNGGWASAGFSKYLEFLQYDPYAANGSNLIYFGAPGTGKSYKLNESLASFGERYERVTFYSDYLHAQFVGSLRPSMEPDTDRTKPDRLAYRFVPGPFTNILVQALNDPTQPYALVIEEINRADAASVFGDLFQLLDRNDEGSSEYSITANADLTKYLLARLDAKGKKHLSGLTKQNVADLGPNKALRIAIPSNMSILATMNSADQGVYPLDTAFKRRWDFVYIGIDESENQIDNKWDAQRHAINDLLLTKAHVNEDKLIGPFFIKRSIPWASKQFSKTFKCKVIMYLFEDAARYKRKEIFTDYASGRNTLSKLFNDWDKKNFAIFTGMERIENFPSNKQ